MTTPPPDRSAAATESSALAVIGTDPAGVVRSWNAAATRLFGFPRREILGRDAWALVPDTLADEARRLRAEVLAGRSVEHVETVRLDRDGRPVPIDLSMAPVVDDRGAVVGIAATVQGLHPDPVTGSTDGSRYRSVVEHAGDALTLVGPDGELLFANPAAERLLGFDPVARPGHSVREFVHPDDADRVSESLAETAATGRPRAPVEFRLAAADGTWHWMEATADRASAGPSSEGVVLDARDVTERRAAEERLRAIVDASHEGILVTDPAGRAVFASDRMAELLGVPAAELTERVDPVPPGAAPGPRHAAVVTELLEHGASGDVFRHERPDGDDVWLRPTAHPQTDAGGEPAGMLVMVEDVTALHRSEQRIVRQDAWQRAVMRHAFDLVVVVDRDGAIQYGSAGVEQLLGYPVGELRGATALNVVSPADRARAAAALEQVVREGGVSESFELRVLHRDGSYRWIEARATNLLDDPAVGAVIIHGRDVTDRRLAEAEMSYRSLHDPLTGLPNRLLLHHTLSAMLDRCERDEHVGVYFIDIDRFRLINDARGHLIGDALLQEVAARLATVVKRDDALIRFGGDAFVLVVEGVRTEADAVRLGDRILREAFGEPFRVDGDLTHVSASIGVALGNDPHLLDRLLADADAAMDRAKANGRARVEMFEETMRMTASAHFEMEQALRLAIERDELTVFYQPVVSLAAERIIGVEALVRWNHPERGLVEPDEFIPLAEETGLIVPIGALVFAEACAQMHEIRNRWPDIDFSMSVNVSPLQLRTGSAAEFGSVARAALVEPRDLILEVTESVLIGEDDAVVDALRVVQGEGIRVAVDDFGTGYSSLSYMKRLPIDILKVDKTFVAGLGVDPQDASVIRAMLAMAESLDLEVVAEGVETPVQLEQLRFLGCRYAQGFLFGRPVPAWSLEARLEHGVGVAVRGVGSERHDR